MRNGEIILGRIRVSVLSGQLVRIEVQGPSGFEDRPTFLVVERDWSVPDYRVERHRAATHVVTQHYEVLVPHGAESLQAVVVRSPASGKPFWIGDAGLPARPAWPSPGQPGYSWAVADSPRVVPPAWGACPPPAGYLASDDAHRDVSGWDLTNDAPDVYVFVHLGDLAAWRREFLRLTGPIPLPPLWAFGFWHSLYHPYTDREILQTIDEYRARGFPLDVFVVDTDWRVGGSGGYDVERKYFPDMARFIREAHARNAKLVFNDHPQPNGFQPIEPAMLKFRSDGLTTFLRMGLDAWWYDFNWVEIIPGPVDGIDKGVWGQKLYWDIASAHQPERRTMLMSMRSDHPASHRYPIWWTGDIPTTYEAMADGVRDSVGDGVKLTPYTNQDLGGHLGQPDDEQYVRWLQWGCLSPTARIHGTRRDGLFRDPWRFGAAAASIIRDFIRLRYRLLPVIYAAARRAYDEGLPMLRRLDFEWPDHREAQANDQYLLGDDLLVAPITTPAPPGGRAERSLWIPPGEWENLWTGEIATGPCTLTVACDLHEMPLFVRRGGVVLLAPDMAHTGEKPWDPVTVEAFAGPPGTTTRELYEDDGAGNGYLNGIFRRTLVTLSVGAGFMKFAIERGEGAWTEGEERAWRLRLHLRPGQRVASCEHPHRILPPVSPAARTVLSGWGESPRAASGAVVEIELPRAALPATAVVHLAPA